MKKKTGLIGLYSGRKIKEMAAKGERLTRKQTAKQALTAIEAKYGNIVYNALYYYAGVKRKWVRRSKEADARRTGNVTTSVKKWRRQPHKYDLRGVDTKGSRKQSAKKPAVKIKTAYGKIATEFKNELIKALKQQNAEKIKVQAGIKEFKPGPGPTYHTVTYSADYENGYPVFDFRTKADTLEKKFRDKYKTAKLLYDRKNVNRTYSTPVYNYALNAWRQDNPNSSIETAKKRAMRDLMDFKLSEAAMKGILSDPLSKPIKEVPKKLNITPVKYTQTIRKMRFNANVTDLAADYKFRGAKRAGDAYSLFVKDRMLKPEISAKEFKKVFDVVSPEKFLESKTVTREVKLSAEMLRMPGPARRGGKGPKPKPTLKPIARKTKIALQKLPLSYKKKTAIPGDLKGLAHPIIIKRGTQYYIRKPWGANLYSDLKAEKTRFNDLHPNDSYYMAGMPNIGSYGYLKLVERGKPPRIEYKESSLAGGKQININLATPKNPIVYRWVGSKSVNMKEKTANEIIKEWKERKKIKNAVSSEEALEAIKKDTCINAYPPENISKRKHLMCHYLYKGVHGFVDLTVLRKSSGNASVPVYKYSDGEMKFVGYQGAQKLRSEGIL